MVVAIGVCVCTCRINREIPFRTLKYIPLKSAQLICVFCLSRLRLAYCGDVQILNVFQIDSISFGFIVNAIEAPVYHVLFAPKTKSNANRFKCYRGIFVVLMYKSIIETKKAKLLNGGPSSLTPVHATNANGNGSTSSSDEYQTYQAQYCVTAVPTTTTTAAVPSSPTATTAPPPPPPAAATQSSRANGPNLVNKQLVLPFVPPSFPNGALDGSNHLIKPSEYLKSISDKRSSASSAR